MDKLSNTVEIKKTKVFSKWVVFHSINLFIAFLWVAYFDPLSDITFRSVTPKGSFYEVLGGVLGLFFVMMFIPWLIAAIHKLIKKRSSTFYLFIIYYFILLFWFVLFVGNSIKGHYALKINLLSKFEDPNRFALFFLLLFFLLIFLGIRLWIIKANKPKSVNINVVSNPDIDDKT